MTPIVADFSHWDAFDPVALFARGVRAVVLKATQGTGFVDPEFVGRLVAAKQAGLLVGAYHFADGSDAILQVDLFLRVAGALPMLALDLEPNSIGSTVTGLIAARMVSAIQGARRRVPTAYTGRYGPSGTGMEYPNPVLARCPLWLAEYQAPKPQLPAGWTTWAMWQYTDSPDDYDYWNGTSDELTAFFS